MSMSWLTVNHCCSSLLQVKTPEQQAAMDAQLKELDLEVDGVEVTASMHAVLPPKCSHWRAHNAYSSVHLLRPRAYHGTMRARSK